ncbi:Oxidase ustYa [Colletotrichum sidae]|uniref:Oxidase ustYa n=2 Tax=Colletotrichum orbiculare species complex TaxID=2707354 RepID=A0A4R8Q5E3_9PEZI|nr:Oxidase ustYa [Colletotrichum spinosum]TEA19952.1 Oxidase ustYa [Colletotrichum sidae]
MDSKHDIKGSINSRIAVEENIVMEEFCCDGGKESYEELAEARRLLKKRKRQILALAAVLIITTVAWVGAVAGLMPNWAKPKRMCGSPVLSDVHGVVPQLAQREKVFWNESRFTQEDRIMRGDPPDVVLRRIEENWRSLMPANDGFVAVPRTEKYKNLPPPLMDDKNMPRAIYDVAVFHQLRCLGEMLQSWVGFYYGQPRDEIFPSHVLHCYDYLRFGLMCGADTALEGSSDMMGQRLGMGTMGLGTTHVCRDWDALSEWMSGGFN